MSFQLRKTRFAVYLNPYPSKTAEIYKKQEKIALSFKNERALMLIFLLHYSNFMVEHKLSSLKDTLSGIN